MNNAEKRRKAQQQSKAAKKAAMFEAGEKSRYYKRMQTRLRGVPMSSRSHEAAPWHKSLTSWVDMVAYRAALRALQA